MRTLLGSLSSSRIVKWSVFHDRNQLAGEMSLRPVCVEISAASDHRRQLARAIGDGKWLVDARQAHWREGFDLDLGQLDLIVDMGGVAERSEFKYP